MLSRKPVKMSLPFRDSRNYLHSTDILLALMDLARDRFSSKAFVNSLMIRRPACHQVQACFDPEASAFASFGIRNGSEHVKGWLVETDERISLRIPFDESPAMSAVVCGPGFACFAEPVQGYTPFEQLVILMRALASQLGPQQWWVSQLNLCSPIVETRALEIRLRGNVLDRFLTGDISQDGHIIGSARGIVKSAAPQRVEAGKPNE
jgi:hypothetical protein